MTHSDTSLDAADKRKRGVKLLIKRREALTRALVRSVLEYWHAFECPIPWQALSRRHAVECVRAGWKTMDLLKVCEARQLVHAVRDRRSKRHGLWVFPGEVWNTWDADAREIAQMRVDRHSYVPKELSAVIEVAKPDPYQAPAPSFEYVKGPGMELFVPSAEEVQAAERTLSKNVPMPISSTDSASDEDHALFVSSLHDLNNSD